MSTKELLRDKLAPAVGRVILKYAFGVDVSTIGGPFLDWLSAKFKDQDQARQAERFARNIANGLVDGLVPVFEHDHGPGLNPEAVALALGDTLDRYIDSKFIVAHDLDPKQLIKGAFDVRPLSQLKREGYATSDIEVYRRALPELIAALVPRAKQFGDFEVANAAEVLKRLRDLALEGRRTREGVDSLVMAKRVWERRCTHAWLAFERDYAEAILDRWNKLELFGIDVSAEVQRKQKLSVAYIQLNLQSVGVEDASAGSGSLASFEELLARSAENGQPLVIRGEAGGGKTTILRWAACCAVTRQLEGDPLNPFTSLRSERFGPGFANARSFEEQRKLAWWARVPLLLRLREVQDGHLPKEDAWPGKSAGLPRDPPSDWLEEILGGGHGLILLDGLDELGSTGRDIARDTLRSILRDRRGNLVVVTSRPGAFEADWFEGIPFQLATIRAMSPAQREACIANWHEAVAQAKPSEAAQTRKLGEDLTQKIRISPYLQEPTTNPLICAATCALHHGRKGYLPSGLVDLFDALCKMLIHERDQQQGLIEQAHVPEAYRRLDLGHKRQLLEEIAAEMVLNRQSQRSHADTLVCVTEKLSGIPEHRNAAPEDILKGLLLRSGLLRPSGDNAVDFLHNAFKEYLAAARFLARRSNPFLVEAADHDPGDRVFAYAYAIASARGEEALTKELVDGLLDSAAPDEETRRRREILGLRCRGVTVSAAGSILDRFDQLIDQVLPPHDAQEAEAIATLGNEVIEQLRQPDEPPEVAAACAHALVSIGTNDARRALESFKTTKHQSVAEELALVFNPLEVSYWQEKATTRLERPHESHAAVFPDTVARQVTDLAPLQRLIGVKELYLQRTAASDLTPLGGLTDLRILWLNDTAVTDLEPLAGLTGLQTLYLNNTAVTDLKALAGLVGLQWLSLDHTLVYDLAPLRSLRDLQSLYFDGTAVIDLTPLSELTSLERLTLASTRVTDLKPLGTLTGLQWLWIPDTTVADLKPLVGLAGLQSLILDNTAVTDLTPLASLTGLQELSLNDTAVTDLTPLASLAGLESLYLDDTSVADLTPLASLTALRSLDLANTAVTDLTPLASLTGLRSLSLNNTAVDDLEPVKHIEGLQIYGP